MAEIGLKTMHGAWRVGGAAQAEEAERAGRRAAGGGAGEGQAWSSKVGDAPVGNGSDRVADASEAVPLKKGKKNKAKVIAEPGADTPRSYPDSVAWG